MNIQIKLDAVQQAELKEVMKKDRRTMTQQEVISVTIAVKL